MAASAPSKASFRVPSRAIIMEDLRRRISRLDGTPVAALRDRVRPHDVMPFGVDAIDRALPGGGLALGALHEVLAADYRDRPAALGLCTTLAARLMQRRPGPMLWCQAGDGGDALQPYAPGLSGLGFDPDRVTFLTAGNEQDMLWAMEEAVSCAAVAGVVGVLDKERHYGFTASRRLSLRAKENGVTLLLARPHRAPETTGGSTAVESRWRVAARPSATPTRRRVFLPSLGQPSWQLALIYGRGIKPGQWDIEWDNETVRFALAAELADRPRAAPARDGADALRHTG